MIIPNRSEYLKALKRLERLSNDDEELNAYQKHELIELEDAIYAYELAHGGLDG